MAQSVVEEVGAPSVVPASAPKKGKARIVFPALIALALAGGAASYVHGLGRESTDDAQIEGHVTNVAPRVSGQVKRVLVKDNQAVKPGDVLVELDDRDIAARFAAAKADVAAAKAQARAAEAQVALTKKSVDASLLGALRPFLKETRAGLGAKADKLADEIGKSTDDLLASLVAAGLKVPEKPREKATRVEFGGERFWLSKNARGELWLNVQAAREGAAEEESEDEGEGESAEATSEGESAEAQA